MAALNLFFVGISRTFICVDLSSRLSDSGAIILQRQSRERGYTSP